MSSPNSEPSSFGSGAGTVRTTRSPITIRFGLAAGTEFFSRVPPQPYLSLDADGEGFNASVFFLDACAIDGTAYITLALTSPKLSFTAVSSDPTTMEVMVEPGQCL